MKPRFTDMLSFGAALLVAGSMLYGFQPVNAEQDRFNTEIPSVATISIPTFKEIKKVEQVPTPIVEAPKIASQTVTASAPAGDNETVVWNYLISQGFSRNQTAGIMGNLQQEHGFRTDGDGLAQWNGGRRSNLRSNPNWQDINVQVAFLVNELKSGYIHVYNQIKSTEDLGTIAVVFQNQFEKCDPKWCMQDQRISYAQKILARH